MPTIPRPSRSTLREFGFQLATIIAGILIALWVDSLVEARRERAIVRDAHAAIAREIAENLQDLSASLPSLDEHERGLRTCLQFANDLRTRGKTDIRTSERRHRHADPESRELAVRGTDRARSATWRSRTSRNTRKSMSCRTSS